MADDAMPIPDSQDFKPPSLDNLINESNPDGDPAKAGAPDAASQAKPEGDAADAKDKDTGDKAAAGDKPDKAKGEPPSPDEAESDAAAKADTDADAGDDKGDKGDKDVPAHVIKRIREDARKKADQLEAELTDTKARLAKLERPQRPDEIDDPEGARDFDQQQFADQRWNDRVSMSKEIMRELHEDYDDVEAVFRAEAVNNPALAAQLAQHPFPAKFAYNEGKRLTKLQELGEDPEAAIQKRVDEAVAKAKEEFIAELKKQGQEATNASVPESLADAPSAVDKSKGGFEGPKPLDEIITS